MAESAGVVGRVGSMVRATMAVLRGFGRLPLLRHARAMQLRRLTPLAGGRTRGQPVIRVYWERFLDRHAADIRGRALEVGDVATLRTRGGPAITHADAIDLTPRPGVTIVADLSRADALAPGVYDCIVLPFTMHLVADVEAAMYHAIRLLAPGGTLLVNFPCVDYCFPRGLDMATGRTLFVHWFFTPLQVENLLRRVGLSDRDYEMQVDGNLFARIAYQMNLPSEELTREEIERRDPGHPLLISVRVRKPDGWSCARPDYRDVWVPSTTPDRWNPVTGHYPLRARD